MHKNNKKHKNVKQVTLTQMLFIHVKSKKRIKSIKNTNVQANESKQMQNKQTKAKMTTMHIKRLSGRKSLCA